MAKECEKREGIQQMSNEPEQPSPKESDQQPPIESDPQPVELDQQELVESDKNIDEVINDAVKDQEPVTQNS